MVRELLRSKSAEAVREPSSNSRLGVSSGDIIFAMFDAVHPDLQIVSVSDGWTTHFGRRAQENGSLLLMFSESMAQEFKGWIQFQLNCIISDGWTSELTRVKFKRLRGTYPDGRVYKETIVVGFPDPLDLSIEDATSYIASISIEHVRLQTVSGFSGSPLPVVHEEVPEPRLPTSQVPRLGGDCKEQL